MPRDVIELAGVGRAYIDPTDAQRQAQTARTILQRMADQPGVLLADEVGMGKTYVAMAVVASVIVSSRRTHCPVIVMVPAGLRQKWQRDWEQFKTHCVRDHVLDWVRDGYAHTPTEFFKLLDGRVEERINLVFVTTGCFSRGLNDPWVKLAMIRLARSMTRLTDTQKRRVYRWASDLVRQFSNYRLTEDVVDRLMHCDVLDWKRILVSEGIFSEDEDDPVPDLLSKDAHKLDWTDLCAVLRDLPGWRPEHVQTSFRNKVRREFGDACRSVYTQWLNLARWRSPLLVLDEAHHAKNDSTRLAQLFRPETKEDVALLHEKFDGMLFLTATPFQLGHQELIRVLRSFSAVRWSRAEAPAGTREDFEARMCKLEQALDRNRLAGRRFDRYWGKLRVDMLGVLDAGEDEEQRLLSWWKNVQASPEDPWQQQLVQAYRDCVTTREQAELLLKPWLIRHNRLPHLPSAPDVPRRNIVVGRAIGTNRNGGPHHAAVGLPIQDAALLPFLITARAQGQLAQSAGTRAFFAEGLASSYEAFHHTREGRLAAKDLDDGLEADDKGCSWMVPTRWYEEQIAQLIPSRDASRERRMAHPKVAATVERAVDLWFAGEKVLVFCFYIQTAHALSEHLREEINQRIIDIAAKKLGLDPRLETSEVQNWLARIVRRLSDADSPFHREIVSILDVELDAPQYMVLRRYREELRGVLMAYFRSPAFVARYLPLDDASIRDALAERETRRNVINLGIEALRHAIQEERDASNQTYLGRIVQFLDFACELAERAERHLKLKADEDSDESENPLLEYLDAVSIYSKARRLEHADEDAVEDEKDDGSYRVMPLVRMVYGKTKTEIRDRLMLAFNSPLFPEILVSSSVMGEGVDLHRFCRHIIHHDLCWNPSTLEQRTGRLDRVRCKAEVCCRPIEIYEPFLAGSADEKMFRVLRDRERWFQIVMGQKFEFDEAASEAIANRLILPAELAKQLTFSLACWDAAESGRVAEKRDTAANANSG
jgi:superfamily II DNA or RNA helicase